MSDQWDEETSLRGDALPEELYQKVIACLKQNGYADLAEELAAWQASELASLK